MRPRWIHLLYVVLLIIAVYLGIRAATAIVSGSESQAATQAPSSAASRGPTTIVDLPLAEQAAVSTAIGREDSVCHARAVETGWQMQEAGQGVAAAFGDDGVTFTTGSTAWGLHVRGFGRSNAVASLVPVEPQSAANRVEYQHAAMTEWYVNGPAGVEQGFTVPRRVEGPSDAPLRIEMAMEGGLFAEVDADATGLTLRDADGVSRLRYHGLVAFDTRGRQLPATMDVEESVVAVEVDDSQAEYPIVIDPFVQRQKLTASDGAAGDYFGYQFAVSPDTLLVGAPFRTNDSDPLLPPAIGGGAAYRFSRNPTSPGWEFQEAYYGAGAGDNLGAALAVSGNVFVVGVAGLDLLQSNHVMAMVHVRDSTGAWSFYQALVAPDLAAGDTFGQSVAVSGTTISDTTIIVGAPMDNIGTPATGGVKTDQGSAWVFTFNSATTTWTEQAKLTASDGAANDQFGSTVAISGNLAAVGAALDDVGAPFGVAGGVPTGVVHVFGPPLTFDLPVSSERPVNPST